MPLALPIANGEEPSTPERLQEHLQRILNSPQFARAETQRRLLEYLWQHRSENLNEYAIATDALGRKADFDSAVDASVRVHISRLRRKLKDYYQETGEPEILVIPTGTHQLLVVEVPVTVTPEPDAAPKLPVTAPAVLPRSWVIALSAACFLVAGVLGWVAGHRSVALSAPRATAFWSGFLNHNAAPIKIILPTPVFFSFANNRDIRIRSTSVNDFHQAAIDPAFTALTKDLGTPALDQHYTVTADTLAAVDLARYLDSVGQRQRVSFEVMRDSDMLVLEQSNVIALGTYQTLHPLHDYLEAMNFSLNHDEEAALNAKPGPGEKKSYPMTQESAEREVRPSIIAMLPGRSPGLRILLIESQETAAQISLLSSSAGANSIETMLRSHGNPEYWEMVVYTESNQGHALRTWPVTVHAFPAHAPSSEM
jgi:Transcriptional regulatory protein, C terminal